VDAAVTVDVLDELVELLEVRDARPEVEVAPEGVEDVVPLGLPVLVHGLGRGG